MDMNEPDKQTQDLMILNDMAYIIDVCCIRLFEGSTQRN